jgi:hypothetical protein
MRNMNKPLRLAIAPLAVAIGAASLSGCGSGQYRFNGSAVCLNEASAVTSPLYPGAGKGKHKGLLVKVPSALPKGVVALAFAFLGSHGYQHSAPEDEASLTPYDGQFVFGIKEGSDQFEVVPVERAGSKEQPGLLRAGSSGVDFPPKTAVATAQPWPVVNTEGLQPIFTADIPDC